MVISGGCNVSIGAPINITLSPGREDTYSLSNLSTISLSTTSPSFSGWLVNGVSNLNPSITINITGDTLVQSFTTTVVPTIMASLSVSPWGSTNQSWVVSCTASDSGNYPLSYTWSTNGGNFVVSNNSSIMWSLPVPGNYTVTCVVSDSYGVTKTLVKTVTY